MMRGALDAIKGFKGGAEFVIGIGRGHQWWADDGEFMIRKVSLAEGIFTVTLLQNTAVAHSKRGKKCS